jgi:hypothetical protein
MLVDTSSGVNTTTEASLQAEPSLNTTLTLLYNSVCSSTAVAAADDCCTE